MSMSVGAIMSMTVVSECSNEHVGGAITSMTVVSECSNKHFLISDVDVVQTVYADEQKKGNECLYLTSLQKMI